MARFMPSSESPKNKHDAYAAWRHRDYRRYASGAIAGSIGVQIQSVAIGWELYERTGEALALAMVALMQALPAIGLALPAGFLADRFDRRRIIVAAMCATSITSLILGYLSYTTAPIWLMYVVLLLDATLMTLARPARSALLPALVPRADFASAMTWNMSLFQTAMFVGPALGGFIVAWSVQAAYVICACTTLWCMVMFLTLKMPYRFTPTDRTPPSWASVLAGARFLWRSKALLSAVSLDMFAVLLGGAVYLMPIFAKDILDVGAEGLGWLNAAPAVGAFITSFVIAHLPPMRKAGRNLFLAVIGFGLATIVFGFSTHFGLSLAMLFLIGATDAVSVVIRHTLVQLLTPDDMRGRLSAVNSVFISTSNQIGGLESGVVAQYVGPVISVVAGGVGTIIVTGIIAIACPKLRRFGALHDAQPEQ